MFSGAENPQVLCVIGRYVNSTERRPSGILQTLDFFSMICILIKLEEFQINLRISNQRTKLSLNFSFSVWNIFGSSLISVL